MLKHKHIWLIFNVLIHLTQNDTSKLNITLNYIQLNISYYNQNKMSYLIYVQDLN